jgi:hypothetical protein
MAYKANFIEVEPEKPCCYCGRKKLNKSEKFFKVFIGDRDFGMVVCEFCKGSYSTHIFEGSERTYATHLTFYLKRSLFELKDKLHGMITAELSSAIEDYEDGKYSASFRSIGLVAEWITDRLLVKKFGELPVKEKLSWDSKLGRLLDKSRKDDKVLEEALVYQLYSLKWFRNKADHPSKYNITAEDIKLGLISIIYLFHQIYSHNLF